MQLFAIVTQRGGDVWRMPLVGGSVRATSSVGLRLETQQGWKVSEKSDNKIELPNFKAKAAGQFWRMWVVCW